ncbi:ABC transporter ATP-binding protein [Virgibacillus sediminis]|uniref:ABC transporter ATP-binding protein n=1 Tax=Virgibacillus sediminis TaxID=202260 RepID=A0ABV7A912_9BACI
MSSNPVLTVDHLQTHFHMEDNQTAKAVDNISFSIFPGETVALVGESGSGKSMTALSIMQLVAKPGRIVDGSISLNGIDLLPLTDKEMTAIRGKEMSMIFQEPMTALNPVFTVGNQISEVLRKHLKLPKKEARDKTINLLKTVGIPRAESVVDEYPHQLSGGMRQRVMIAMAISCNPNLLIADEPTTALDVTMQAQILDLLKDMKDKYQMALLLITHDLGIVAEYADRVLVMYGGQIVEESPVAKLVESNKHPYTKGLLESLPSMDVEVDRLGTIKGTVPPAHQFPIGCRFSARCPYVMDKCREVTPAMEKVDSNHFIRCYLYEKGVSEHDS